MEKEQGKVRQVLQTKYVVSVGVELTCMCMQNGFAVRWLVGTVLNSILAKALKRLFNQPRPEKAQQEGKTDPGFPSCHSHILFSIAVYLALALPNTVVFHRVLLVASFLTAAIGSIWRVLISRHTMVQVLAGVVSGGLGAMLYHAFWTVLGTDWFDAMVERTVQENGIMSMLFLVITGGMCFAALTVFSDKITMSNQIELQQPTAGLSITKSAL